MRPTPSARLFRLRDRSSSRRRFSVGSRNILKHCPSVWIDCRLRGTLAISGLFPKIDRGHVVVPFSGFEEPYKDHGRFLLRTVG